MSLETPLQRIVLVRHAETQVIESWNDRAHQVSA